MKNRLLCLVAAGAVCFLTSVYAAPDPNFHLYLLFGQSNMAGGGNTADLIPADCDTTPRVKVLAFCDCAAGSGPDCKQFPLNRMHDKWYTAYPPLHICSEGISPGDWFAKTMLDSIRDDVTIGLIPCALSGQSIKVFAKGGSNFNIPDWAHPTLANSSPYDWMINRCKIAQETGVIKGVLFHQGESDNGQSSWIASTKAVFENIKKDLGLDAKTPFVVGELVQDAGACCAAHNTLIATLAAQYPNCALASSKDLKMKANDEYKAHFNPAGMRELGKRYARAFLSLADNDFVPRKTVAAGAPRNRSVISPDIVRSSKGELRIYTINGRILETSGSAENINSYRKLNTGNVYLVAQKPGSSVQLMVNP